MYRDRDQNNESLWRTDLWYDVNILYLESGDIAFRYISREPSAGTVNRQLATTPVQCENHPVGNLCSGSLHQLG